MNATFPTDRFHPHVNILRGGAKPDVARSMQGSRDETAFG